MFFIIGLKQDGRMVLCDGVTEKPNKSCLAESAKEFDYQQILVVINEEDFGGGQVARYEFDLTPRLKEVPLV